MSWVLLGLPVPRPLPATFSRRMDGSTGGSRTGIITSGLGTVLLLGGAEGEGLLASLAPHCPKHGPERAAAPVPRRRDARPLRGEERVGRVISSSGYSLVLQTWFGCAASGGLLSPASGEISTAFNTIKIASKYHGPAQYKITVNSDYQLLHKAHKY